MFKQHNILFLVYFGIISIPYTFEYYPMFRNGRLFIDQFRHGLQNASEMFIVFCLLHLVVGVVIGFLIVFSGSHASWFFLAAQIHSTLDFLVLCPELILPCFLLLPLIERNNSCTLLCFILLTCLIDISRYGLYIISNATLLVLYIISAIIYR